VTAILKFLVVGLVGSFGVGALTARANLEVSATVSVHATADFYAPLTPSGAWIDVRPYGRCWRPSAVAPGWRPYCNGRWVWTDCGWYWASDEPWAWACYHYGCWVDDPLQAWVWVPGIEWAPAWVTWRAGDGYIGWAPLPPPGVTVADPWFVFVHTAQFRRPIRPSTVLVNNSTVLHQTTVINNLKRETRQLGAAGPQQVVINQGPGLAPVQDASRMTIKPLPIGEAARLTRAPATLTRGPGQPKLPDKPALAAPEPPKSASESKAPPAERVVPPAPSPPPGMNPHPPTERLTPSPHAPPESALPPGTGPRPAEERGEGKGHE